jgi:hypothetical protein
MFVSTKTTLMEFLTRYGNSPERQGRREQRKGAFACGYVLRIFGYQLTQLIGEQSAHTASPTRGDGACFLKQAGFDGKSDVVLNGHGVWIQSECAVT